MPKVTKARRKKWKAESEYGDNRKISEKYKISEVTICNAKRTGRGSDNTIKCINEYYGLK